VSSRSTKLSWHKLRARLRLANQAGTARATFWRAAPRAPRPRLLSPREVTTRLKLRSRKP
jgi:hypothetical protein